MSKKLFKATLTGLTLATAINAQATVLSKDIRQAALEIQNVAKSSNLTAKSCKSTLKDLSDSLFNLAPDHFTNDADVKELADGSDALSRLFKARTILAERFKNFVVKSEFIDKTELDECANQLRITLRTIRDLEDVTGLNSIHKAKSAQKNVVYPLVDTSYPNLLTNRDLFGSTKLDKKNIKSGDIFLIKGTMFASAPISRIGTVDNQFTHIAVAYIDDGTLFGEKNKGQIYFVEAEPDYGVQIVGFDFFIKDTKARLLHYRYSETNGDAAKSARLAAEAALYVAKKSYPRVNEKDPTDTTMKDWKNPSGLTEAVRYNFAMDLSDTNSLFCSQVVSYAFDQICTDITKNCERFPRYELPGRSPIPIAVSQFDVEKNSLAKILNLKKTEIFSPADVEIDPRFQLLSEWRDFSKISESRITDMVITKIFQYIENQKYEFVTTPALELLAVTGNKLIKEIDMLPSYSPDGYAKGTMMMAFLIKYTGPGQLIVDKVKNLPTETIKNMLVQYGMPAALAAEYSVKSKPILERILNHVSIVTRITNLNDKNLSVKGRHLTAKQMDLVVDYVRNDDCKRYLTGQGGPVMYHDIFRRNNTTDKSKQCDQVNTPINSLVQW